MEKVTLGKEYIESKGFNAFEADVYGDIEFRSEDTYLGLSTGDDKKLWINWWGDRGETMIYWRTNSGHEDILFDGFLETEEDFDTILKLLRI